MPANTQFSKLLNLLLLLSSVFLFFKSKTSKCSQRSQWLCWQIFFFISSWKWTKLAKPFYKPAHLGPRKSFLNFFNQKSCDTDPLIIVPGWFQFEEWSLLVQIWIQVQANTIILQNLNLIHEHLYLSLQKQEKCTCWISTNSYWNYAICI